MFLHLLLHCQMPNQLLLKDKSRIKIGLFECFHQVGKFISMLFFLHLFLLLLLHVVLLDNVQEEEGVLQGAPGVSLHILRNRVIHLHLRLKVIKK